MFFQLYVMNKLCPYLVTRIHRIKLADRSRTVYSERFENLNLIANCSKCFCTYFAHTDIINPNCLIF